MKSFSFLAFVALCLVACGSGPESQAVAPGGELSSSSLAWSSTPFSSSFSVSSSSAAPVDSVHPPAVITGDATVYILRAYNPRLFHDIEFSLQPDSSYLVTLPPEVNLTQAVLSFGYTGTVSMGGVPLVSGVSAVDFSTGGTIDFGDKQVRFQVDRQYGIPSLSINTVGSVAVDTAYVICSLRLDGKNLYSDFSASDAGIRLRGNSTRAFYEKKPMRIKLASKAALLGLAEDKDWVLLANYRDPTNFMNAVVFDMARHMGMPYTNSNRFVEVTFNGEYIGMYQFTEQVEQGTNRVAIDALTGVLLNLDLDDGPLLAPNAGDNFLSTVYQLPVCVKNPKDQTAAQLDSIRADFATLENLVRMGPYSSLAARLDMASAINFLILQELTRNVELVSPRSMYMYKSADNIYHYGPVWDFDGGFAFDWASMEDGHGFFGSQTWLMGSTNPSEQPRDAYDLIPGFFVDLFAYPEFVAAYQARWNALNPGMLTQVFAQLDGYALQAGPAMTRNSVRWPIGLDPNTEIQRMKDWLNTRAASYSTIIQGY